MNSTEAVKVLREALGKLLPYARPLDNAGPIGEGYQTYGFECAIEEADSAITATESIEQDDPVNEVATDHPDNTMSWLLRTAMPVGTKLYTSPQPAKPDALVPEWISVDERLPEISTRKVIVWCHMFYAPSYMHVGTYGEGNWDVGDSRVNRAGGYVSHWMPLPAAPSPEQS